MTVLYFYVNIVRDYCTWIYMETNAAWKKSRYFYYFERSNPSIQICNS